jgi:hypothetical protein
LNRTADPELVKVWKEQEVSAMMGRNVNPESMDIYDIKIQKGSSYHNSLISMTNCIPGPSKDEMQLLLMNDERASVGTKGATTLIGDGLKIEESQYVDTSSAPGVGRSYSFIEHSLQHLHADLAEMRLQKKNLTLRSGNSVYSPDSTSSMSALHSFGQLMTTIFGWRVEWLIHSTFFLPIQKKKNYHHGISPIWTKVLKNLFCCFHRISD